MSFHVPRVVRPTPLESKTRPEVRPDRGGSDAPGFVGCAVSLTYILFHHGKVLRLGFGPPSTQEISR